MISRAAVLVALSFLLTAACAPPKLAKTANLRKPRPHPPTRSTEPEDEKEADSPREAAEFFLKKRQPRSLRDFPTERYLRAKQDSHRLPLLRLGPTPFSSGRESLDAAPSLGNWQALGPGNVGGRIRGIAVDPTNPNTLYAAAASGGVWKTTDGGKNWNPLTDLLPVLGAGALVMDPTNPRTLYLGTGEFFENAISLRGAGIFKTTDAGQTWNQLPSTNTPDFYFVNALAINPKQPSHIYAGTSTGLFRSLDGGATWKAMILKSGVSYYCASLALRSDQLTDYLFAACGTYVDGVFHFTVFRNRDAGGSGTFESALTNTAMGTTVVALAPSAQDTVYALSVTNDQESAFRQALLAVYRSTQAGAANTWTRQADTSSPTGMKANILSYPNCTYEPDDHHGQGDYDIFLAVDPVNPDVLFAGAIDVFRSDNAGVNWGWTNMYDGGHPDQHAIAFHPAYDGVKNQTLWIGNDGGMFRTDKARGSVATSPQAFCTRGTYVPWVNLNNSLSVTQFYHGAVVPGGAAYFGGTQDNGTPIGYSARGLNGWSFLDGGDGGMVSVDPVDTNTRFFENFNLSLEKTIDGGLTNYYSYNGITEDPDNFQSVTYYTQDPSDPMKMYLGGSQLWRTLDEAENWTAASAPIPDVDGTSDVISAITVDPADPNHILFGTALGRVYRVTNALTSDANATFPGSTPRDGYVGGIVFDPATPGRVYVAYPTFRDSPKTDSQIYRSDDSGVTWTPLGLGGTAPLPDVPVDALLLDPDDSTRLYAGTDTGLLVSLDRGITWSRDANPFADAVIESLVIDRHAGGKFLYAFTHGRGVWKVNLDATPGPPCTYSVSTSSITATGDETIGSVDVSTGSACTWTAHPGSDFITVQSPATGVGPGHVYYRLNYNDSGDPRTDTFYVQDQAVKVSQSTATASDHGASNDLVASPHVISRLPYGDAVDNSTATSSKADPVHSCTHSADSKTLWWRYAATAAGQVIVSVTAENLDVPGNTGIALTAYPLVSGAPGAELACAQYPESTNVGWKAGTLTFPVTAGTIYLIEVSAINSDNAYLLLKASLLPAVSISPANPTVAAGAKQQFSATVSGVPNTAVRWILSPPVGTLDNAGNYTAPALVNGATKVTITARSFADPNASASTTATIQLAPVAFTAASVVNAASFKGGAVSPGEMVTIFGNGLGPATLAPLQVDSTGKFLQSTVGSSQALFDGVAAPLIYTMAGQLSAIVPYAVAGKASTVVQVKHNGVASSAVSIPVTDAVPALFTLNQAGTGQAAAQSDYLANSPTYPAARGSVVVLYGTGEGRTNPPGQDGLLALTAPYPAPILPVKVQIDGKDAPVQYAGTAPLDVAGILQVNAVVPADASTGDVSVVLSIGGHASPSGVTLNILAPDDRLGYMAYNNTGTKPVTITVYKPGSTTPITIGTVNGGAYNYFTKQQVGNDWGVQINSAPIRIMQHVATFLSTRTPQQWSITGTADNPYPR